MNITSQVMQSGRLKSSRLSSDHIVSSTRKSSTLRASQLASASTSLAKDGADLSGSRSCFIPKNATVLLRATSITELEERQIPTLLENSESTVEGKDTFNASNKPTKLRTGGHRML